MANVTSNQIRLARRSETAIARPILTAFNTAEALTCSALGLGSLSCSIEHRAHGISSAFYVVSDALE